MKKNNWINGRASSFQQKKILLIMKLLFVFMLGFMLQSYAVVSQAQNKRFNLQFDNNTLKEVLQKLEDQTEFSFIYKDESINSENVVSGIFREKKVTEILDKILRNTELSYTINGDVIIILPKDSETFIEQQKQGVSGKVTDNSGVALPGVTVLIKGTTNGTITDTNGNYSLDNIPANTSLQFSFVGMKSQEIVVGKKTTINVTLAEETIGIDEVVAIGYGTQKKRDVSSSISSVPMERLKDKPVANFASAISGQMAGVRISNNNNAPGGGTNIVIRGINSINATNDPLIVIDGFPLQDGFNQSENPLNSINTADIETIEVLKDASSSAIYGAQAANGVIIITTKKGKLGKPTININFSNGVEQMTNRMEPLNREDFLKFLDDSRANAYLVDSPNYGSDNPNAPQWSWTDDNATRIRNWQLYSSDHEWITGAAAAGDFRINRWITVSDETKAQPYDTDWQKVGTQVGKVQDFQISTAGGTENIKYMVSGGILIRKELLVRRVITDFLSGLMLN